MSFLNKSKHYSRDLFKYPKLRKLDETYDTYWESREHLSDVLNSFQKERIELALKYIKSGSSVLDVGCGDGRMLKCLRERVDLGQVFGVDYSDKILDIAGSRGVDVYKRDLKDLKSLNDLPRADFVFLFEVLEHFAHSEELLRWALGHAQKGVMFSVPNTGFVFHRLRLLFGRFPLQWRTHPSEHLRFWTVKDMKWWLKQLGMNYELHTYEGISFLNKIWPNLLSQGIFVFIPVDQRFLSSIESPR